MNSNDKDKYFVAVKVFLEKDGKLFIFKDGFGQWDLPGGRIKTDEFNTPLDQIIHRKMSEELGDDVKYTIDQPIVFMRHERTEQTPGNPTVRIFAIGYQASYEVGEIHLPSHHKELEWVDIKTFKPENYFTGGWLKGIQEYLDIINK